jgi:hypothetical protein
LYMFRVWNYHNSVHKGRRLQLWGDIVGASHQKASYRRGGKGRQ